MKITGKTKEEFEKWLYKRSKGVPLDMFIKYPLEMQIGVLILYFDSVGISADTYKKYHVNKEYYESCVNGYLGAWESRDQAWTQAVEKALEIRESQIQDLTKGNLGTDEYPEPNM